jgi:25S rRNA (adenine2142-N1)-methyltransferase
MLKKCSSNINNEGYLFMVLPESCITNSRYLKYGLLIKIMESLGFVMVKNVLEEYNEKNKLLYYCFQKNEDVQETLEFKRKLCRGGENRNNFCIILKN